MVWLNARSRLRNNNNWEVNLPPIPYGMIHKQSFMNFPKIHIKQKNVNKNDDQIFFVYFLYINPFIDCFI